MSSQAVEGTLLVLKIAFLVLLYLFIWRIVRTASRDVRLPQESFILPPHGGSRDAGRGAGRLVVVRSPTLSPGREEAIDSAPITVGRSADNDLELAGDDYASARHARIHPRRDGVWVEDTGSTNGTFVNGTRLTKPRKLARGDVVRVGETELRFER
jgi:pSer/pThr/pTyr-binding forkhead associated (FHA) protein